ncbi:MAG: malectin domain-containing carbohydrate-binding protein [Anditalea sp.]
MQASIDYCFCKGKILCFFTFCLLFIGSFSSAQTVSFDQSALDFNDLEGINSGTSLQFGPDGRLYTVEIDGNIKILTIEKPGPNQYKVMATETLDGVKTIPNYDDNGDPAYDKRSKRQSTGITVAGTAANPVIYVSSSDPKWGGPSGDKALDTNSGIITRLTWNGSNWEVIDLVRGLPRSEENHSTNGMQLVIIKGKPYLLVASGGLTNSGSPSKNFAYITEYALSAAILSVDLNAIDELPTKIDVLSGRSYKYDLPTLDDPSRANINGIYDPSDLGYDGVDINDPFGGNNGLNMAMLAEGSPVQIFSSGFRNAYDLVVTEDGKLYVTDNGANGTWGGLPENEGNPNLVNNNYRDQEPGNSSLFPDSDGEYVDNKDHLLMITTDLDNYTFGSFYGGHPTPIRANPGTKYEKGLPFPFNPGGAGLYTKFVGDDSDWENITPTFTPLDTFRTQILKPIAPDQPGFDDYASTSLPVNWPPVPVSLSNPAEADFIAPTLTNPDGPQPQIITVWPNNTNGIDEYTATNFEGAIKGALIAGKNGGILHLLEMNQDGSLKSTAFDKWNLNGGNALGITCNSDEDIFPGTIWVATFDNRIMVLSPADDIFCIDPDDPLYDPEADYDHDGFTNQDEVDNGTEPCSGASRPNDYDNDKVSDLNDLDDDGDGIPDELDPYQIGDPRDLPINNELFSNQLDEFGRQSGYLGLGLTGLMNNGAPNPNWLDWLDIIGEGPAENDVYGGTAGAIQVAMTGGTANGTVNNQEKGFQFGVNVDLTTGPFIVRSGLMSLASPGQLYQFDGEGEIGIQMGDGTQSNFIKLVLTKTHVIAAMEINDVVDDNPLMAAIPVEDRPSDTELVELSFIVTPSGGVEPMYQIGNKPAVSLGIMEAAGNILEAIQQEDVPLAIGIIGTSNDFSQEFTGGWDYFKVSGEKPYIIRPLRDVEKLLGDPDKEINLNEYFQDNEGVQNLTFSVIENTDSLFGALITENILTLQFPNDAITSDITVRATDQKGYYVDQTFQVEVRENNTILLRVNAGGTAIKDISDLPDWEENPSAGEFAGSGYSVNSGKVSGFTFDPENRHTSIPDYIDDVTYAELFSRERYNSEQTMEFEFPLPDGKYLVNLYMGNGFEGTSTALQRYFDISIEGNPVATDLDLSGTYGHRVGAMQQYQVELSDGILDIDFIMKKENPLINGIEIIGKPIHTPIEFTPFDNQYSMNNEDLNSGLVVMASGGDGNLKFEASGLPSGIYIEPTNGTIYGTVSENAQANSPYLVTITIDDEDQISSDAVSFNFVWTITPQVEEMFWSDKDEDENYTARHENSFVQAGDKFYLMGGRENVKTIDVYDYVSDSWTSLENSAPESFNHFQAMEYQGLIWVIGAFKTNNFPDEEPADYIWAFDPANQEWIKGPEIPENRRRGSAGLVVYDDKFYILGGNTIGHNGGFVNLFDEYDPATGVWTVLEDAPRARDHFFASVLGNKLYAVSGRLSGGTGGTFGPVIPEVDVYDFNTKTWSTLPPELNLPTPRAAAIVAKFKEKLLIAGGEVPGSTSALSVTEMYDPLLKTWSTIDSLKHARHGTQGIVSGNGLYVLGGSPVRGGGNQKNMEFFGTDQPEGSPSIASKMETDDVVLIKNGIISPVKLNIQDGNQGIFIRSINITGDNALDFVIKSGNINNGLLKANTVHELELEYIGSKQEPTAVLKIDYGKSSSKEIQLVGEGVYQQTSLFFNSGSMEDVEFEGGTFQGDQKFNSYYSTSNTYTNSSASSLPLFRTERTSKNFNYAIPLPNGIYTIKTHHNELWFGQGDMEEGPGKRVFDILIESTLVKDDFDLYTENSNQPTILTFKDIEVSDGELNLGLIASANNASISGISIINQRPLDISPIALISASELKGLAPLPVNFTGSSSIGDIVSYYWDFGEGSTSTEADPSHTFAQQGDYLVTLIVEEETGDLDTATVEVRVLQEEEQEEVSLYLNTGSEASESFNEQAYLGDINFGSYYSSSGTYTNTSASSEPLYQTERSGQTLDYAIPLSNGSYTVRTHHNELWFGWKGPSATAGNRVFDISMEGILVKDDFDIFEEGSNQPTVLTFEDIEVTDGVLNINMSASANYVSISAITITGSGTENEPVMAAISSSVQEGPAPLTVDFTGSGSTGNISHHWDFGDGSTSSEADPSHTFDQPGIYPVTLTVEGIWGDSDSETVEITVLQEEFSLYLNTGSESDVPFNGQSYFGDANFGSYYSSSGTYTNTSASSEPLYQTERTGKTFEYTIPLPNGSYRVRTHHNELWFGWKGPSATAGNRVFDISMEGILVKDDFDIFVEGSNQPTELTFKNVEVSDGVLDITMSATENNVSISGISIESIANNTADSSQFRISSETGNGKAIEGKDVFEKGNLTITLYPNPAKTATNLSINREINLKNILVHNMDGQLVHQFFPSEVRKVDGNYYLPLSDMAQGVYLISLFSENEMIEQLRLIIKP